MPVLVLSKNGFNGNFADSSNRHYYLFASKTWTVLCFMPSTPVLLPLLLSTANLLLLELSMF